VRAHGFSGVYSYSSTRLGEIHLSDIGGVSVIERIMAARSSFLVCVRCLKVYWVDGRHRRNLADVSSKDTTRSGSSSGGDD
jgi:uncharacterized protein with PIN domain